MEQANDNTEFLPLCFFGSAVSQRMWIGAFGDPDAALHKFNSERSEAVRWFGVFPANERNVAACLERIEPYRIAGHMYDMTDEVLEVAFKYTWMNSLAGARPWEGVGSWLQRAD